VIAWLLVSSALAEEPASDPLVEAALHTDLKSFFVASIPYDSALFPDGASATGMLDWRVKLAAEAGDHLRLDVHHAMTGFTAQQASGVGGFGTGVGLSAPEAVDLSWRAFEDGSMGLQGRVDRLALTGSVPGVDLTLGRQPISFGSGTFFTPLDLVNPFTPATIDSEYKPGVDAIRLDAYAGVSGKITAAAAYAGDWDVDGMVFALNGQLTVGVTDLGLFLGEVHGDEVAGLSAISSVGVFGLHGDASVTLPDGGGDPFVRAVAGGDVRPTNTTFVSAEVYLQSFGATDAADYSAAFLDPRYARGEVWLLGLAYAGVAVGQEITPLVSANVSVIGNVVDPSALLVAGLSVSVSDDAAIALGAFYGLGERPGELDLTTGSLPLNSEFGLYPAALYSQVRVYF
jgi:hypothetical protein